MSKNDSSGQELKSFHLNDPIENHVRSNSSFNGVLLSNRKASYPATIGNPEFKQILAMKPPGDLSVFDSRDTLVKRSPNGGLQITYKNMFAPKQYMASSQLKFILPKPVTLNNNGVVDDYETPLKSLASLVNGRSETLSSSSSQTLVNDPLSVMSNSLNDEQCSVEPHRIHEFCSQKHMQINLPTMNEKKSLVSEKLIPNGKMLLSNSVSDVVIDSLLCNESMPSPKYTHCKSASTVTTSSSLGTPFNSSHDLSCIDLDPIDSICLNDFLDSDFSLLDNHIMTEDMNFKGTNDMDIEFSLENELNSNLNDATTMSCVNDELVEIIDVSPETCSTSGGRKLLLIGSWNAKDARYFCQFGSQIVYAELIQAGVLRCYSPAHNPGKVKLCVLSNGKVISMEVDFEFVSASDGQSNCQIQHMNWKSISERSLIHLLGERLVAIAGLMGEDSISEIISQASKNTDEFENVLVECCERLTNIQVQFDFNYDIKNNMTVLHLAAALGYMKLIQLLMNWVESNPNKLLNIEANPTLLDQFHLLPIMWAAAKGHFNATCVLHVWNETSLQATDICGCTAIDLAREAGYMSLVEHLERLVKKTSKDKKTGKEVDQQSSVMYKALHDGYEGSHLATLGKTLAHIQSIISDQDDAMMDNEEDDTSVFESSPFTPSGPADNPCTSLFDQSNRSPLQILTQSPFSRQTRETAEFCEFFFKAKKIEKDFAELTLTDEEQAELYRAANIIQRAYKTYKERKERRDHELSAAVLIQSYYRRYKQYAAFKKMQKGAVIIQSQYRAHREKFKRKSNAAHVIQKCYRKYRSRQHDVYQKNQLQQNQDRKANRYLKQSSSRSRKIKWMNRDKNLDDLNT